MYPCENWLCYVSTFTRETSRSHSFISFRKNREIILVYDDFAHTRFTLRTNTSLTMKYLPVYSDRRTYKVRFRITSLVTIYGTWLRFARSLDLLCSSVPLCSVFLYMSLLLFPHLLPLPVSFAPPLRPLRLSCQYAVTQAKARVGTMYFTGP